MPITPFGRLLRIYRCNHGIRLMEMADKIGLSSSTLSGIEMGKKPIPSGFIKVIAQSYPDMDRITLKKLRQAAQHIPAQGTCIL